MTIYKLPELAEVSALSAPVVLALGNFDGVHRGHRILLSTAISVAAQIPGGVSAVWTFSALAKATENTVPHLTSFSEKLALIGAAGIQYAVVEDFTDVRDLSPRAFVERCLCTNLNTRAAVCGFNFRFGKGAAGDAEVLGRLLGEKKIPLTVVEPVTVQGEPVSSTRIRSAIMDGDMEKAAGLLGGPVTFTMPVEHGHAFGQTMGLPTVNQNFTPGQVLPKGGVYASLVRVDDRVYKAVSNVGTRPTVSVGDRVNMETHILGYKGDLYGTPVTVILCHRIREEQRFSRVEALQERIFRDIEEANEYFAAHPEWIEC